MAKRRHSVGVKQGKPGLASSPAAEAETLEVMISGLADLDVDRLRLQWRNHLGGSAPAHLPRWLLLRVLAFRVQAAALGDLDKATLRLLHLSKDQSVASPDIRPFETRGPATRGGVGLGAGALLVRDWNGELERVMILEKGFAWRGKTYRSLSQIAKAMTGTKWNGHRFFGLRPSSDRLGGPKRGRLRVAGASEPTDAVPSALVPEGGGRSSTPCRDDEGMRARDLAKFSRTHGLPIESRIVEPRGVEEGARPRHVGAGVGP